MSKPGFVDPALLELFRAELDTHLPNLSEGLLALERDPDQPRRLEALMRAAHSVKGAARIVGVDDAVHVAHALEDCFVAAQKGQIELGSDAIDVLLQGVDALGRVCSDSGMPADDVRTAIDAVTAVRQGTSPPKASAATVPSDPLQPSGVLTAQAAEAMRIALVAQVRSATEVMIDLTAVTDMEPAGFLVIARALRLHENVRVQAQAPVSELLRVSRLQPTGS